MALAKIESKTEVAPEAAVADRMTDAIRQAAHFSHEARLMKSMARDAGEEGVYAAKRALRRARRSLDALTNLKDDAAYYVKRQPFKAVGVAAGVGLLVGVVIGFAGRCTGRRSDDEE
jgi:ElaB/YqjD/DUF883 family membrane-anchored ribosome-binding protein